MDVLPHHLSILVAPELVWSLRVLSYSPSTPSATNPPAGGIGRLSFGCLVFWSPRGIRMQPTPANLGGSRRKQRLEISTSPTDVVRIQEATSARRHRQALGCRHAGDWSCGLGAPTLVETSERGRRACCTMAIGQGNSGQPTQCIIGTQDRVASLTTARARRSGRVKNSTLPLLWQYCVFDTAVPTTLRC